MNATRTMGALAIASIAGTAMAQTAEFVNVGSAPGGRPGIFSQLWAISRDGSLVTGKTSAEVGGVEADFGFQAEVGAGAPPQPIEALESVDIMSASGDGEVVVGLVYTEDPRTNESGLFGYSYSDADGFELVLSPIEGFGSTAMDVSADGSTVVGSANRIFDPGTGTLKEAYIQTEASGLQILSDISLGRGEYEALDVDGDGSHVAGYASNLADDRFAVVWETDELSPSTIPELPGTEGSQVATTISDNGRYVAGFSLQEFNNSADFREDPFLYDRQTDEIIALGQTPDGFLSAVPAAVSDDGSTVVGTFDSTGFFDFPQGAAFIWTEQDGLRTLEDALAQDHGLDLPDWELQTVRDMSADTRRIVGHAEEVAFSSLQGYLVTLDTPEPCPADLTGGPDGQPDGMVTSEDFLEFIDLFAAGDPQADFNDDREVTSADFLAYIDAFAQGCP